eukprot:1951443-Pyramimonas_sp.AAC.1
MVTELEEFDDRVELAGENSKRNTIIPSEAWLRRFCCSNYSFGLIILQREAFTTEVILKFLAHSVDKVYRAKPVT